MSIPKLSEGALPIIMTGGEVQQPILQVLGSKKIMGSADKERYRLLISDGKYQISFAMIATQLNELITSGELSTFSIIVIKKYITSMLNNSGKGERRVMVIMDMDIMARGEIVCSKIGDPTQLPDDPSTVLKPAAASNGTVPKPKFTAPKPATNVLKPASAVMPPADQSMSSQLTVPIMNLSPYQNKWVIKARVINKSNIRTWSNSRGEGKLFSMDLADESGEIRATAFRDCVDKFYELIEVDKVYYISKAQVKMANKNFCNINNDYEITFGNETTVTPCFDDVSVPKAVYNFVPIDKMASLDVGQIVDVIGICKSVGDIQTFTTRATGKELKKREITLVDQSNNSIALTLWGNDAQTFTDADQPVLAVRGAKVGEFGGGKNLSVMVNSVLKVNPDIQEAHHLRGWFDNEGKSLETVNLSARTGAGGMRADWHSIAEMKEKRSAGDAAEYFQCKATILMLNSNNALYKACPADDCNKKIIDLENSQYRCEKCNKEYDRFKYRMIMSANIGDWSDNQWVSMFAGEAEKIVGMTSQELGEATENNKESLIPYLSKPTFTEFMVKCRTKMETYNDETRMKTVVMRAEPVNYKEYNKYLVSKLTEAMNL